LSEKAEQIGTILSGGTTQEAVCQLLKSAEAGQITEGKLLLVETGNRRILCRISQIIPYNDFYNIGDSWSEPRREGLQIPDDVARRYEICKLDLLIDIPQAEIKYPPRPGDKVIVLDPKKHEKEIFAVSQGAPKHIWYASLSGYSGPSAAPVPLNMENMPMHMAIFGVTGSGKSYSTGALLEKLSEIPTPGGSKVSYPSIIIDAHGDYVDYVRFAEKNKLGQFGWVRRYVFPKAYLRTDIRGSKVTQAVALNLDLLPARELADIIILYLKGTTDGAEQQIGFLDALFDFMRTEKGYASIHEAFLHHFGDFGDLVRELGDELQTAAATRSAVMRALNHFHEIETRHSLLSTDSDLKLKMSIGGTESISFVEEITKQGGVAIFDFSADGAPGVDLSTKQLVMTYLATLLFIQFTTYKTRRDQNQGDRYLTFIIEEAQNFVPDRSFPVGSSLAHSKLSAIATQGRKFGLGLCLISQRPSFVDRIVLSMCNSFMIHRISPDDVGFVKSVSGGLPASLMPRLTTMNQGDMIITGQLTTVPFPLLVHIPESDRKIKPTVGETNVVSNLAKLRGLS
jgi:hypothetical protein